MKMDYSIYIQIIPFIPFIYGLYIYLKIHGWLAIICLL